MGKFLIFLGTTMVIASAGLLIWLLWSSIYIVIKGQQRAFDIENTAYEKQENKEEKEE